LTGINQLLGLNYDHTTVLNNGGKEITLFTNGSNYSKVILNSSNVADPASLEHFGIAVVEAMAAGCIPIVLNSGGTVDIVQHEINGYLVNNLEGFIKYSLKIISMNRRKREKIQNQAKNRSRMFHVDNFLQKFNIMLYRSKSGLVLKKYIINYMPVLRTITMPYIRPQSTKTAVIIEPEINYHSEFCIRNVLKFLDKSWALQVYHSSYSGDYLKLVLSNIPNVQYRLLPIKITSTRDYNTFLKSYDFWNQIHSEKVLIFQSDSIMLHSGIDAYLQYDYIGAPWNYKNNKLAEELRSQGIIKKGVGNGGFSLRSVSAMRNITKFHRNETATHLQQEDIFFAHFTEKLKYKVPDQKTAYLFAKEVNMPDLDKKYHISIYDHLSLHATWYYVDPATIRKVLKNVIFSMLRPPWLDSNRI
jgi:hypothetical protein